MIRARSSLPVIALLTCALLAQWALGWQLQGLRPTIDEFPPSPGQNGLKALALGDPQFLFRTETMWLQDFGDGGGRVKPLREFDYHHVGDWLQAIDSLDSRSDAVFEMGSRFFGALTDPASASAKVGILVDLFERAGMADPGRRSEWLIWSAVTDQRIVKDPDLSRRIGTDLLSLRDNIDVPNWLPLFAIPMFRIAGDKDEVARLNADPDMIARRFNQLEELRRAKNGDRP